MPADDVAPECHADEPPARGGRPVKLAAYWGRRDGNMISDTYGPRLAAFFARRSPTARRNGMRELLDGDAIPALELAGNLAEIRRINRGLGWTGATLRLIAGVSSLDAGSSFSYLDVATGTGDLPLALVRHAQKRGWTVAAHALDANAGVLDAARRHIGDAPVCLHAGDARALPFADRSFDVVTCALALHHFSPDDAAAVLSELARVASRSWLVVDLERGMIAYLGARLLRVVLRNRLTRHDAPASVLRGYTLPELRVLLARAGLTGASATTQFPFRLVAFGTHATVPA
jgi:SAM-dependent methyltransferase